MAIELLQSAAPAAENQNCLRSLNITRNESTSFSGCAAGNSSAARTIQSDERGEPSPSMLAICKQKEKKYELELFIVIIIIYFRGTENGVRNMLPCARSTFKRILVIF